MKLLLAEHAAENGQDSAEDPPDTVTEAATRSLPPNAPEMTPGSKGHLPEQSLPNAAVSAPVIALASSHPQPLNGEQLDPGIPNLEAASLGTLAVSTREAPAATPAMTLEGSAEGAQNVLRAETAAAHLSLG